MRSATALTVLVLALAAIVLLKPRPVRLAEEALGIGRPIRLLPTVTPKVPTTDFTIMRRDAAGDPVTYDPCHSIHYAVKPAGGPADYMAFIAPAIAAAQAASGLEFVYDGTTAATFDDRQKARQVEPMVISFPAVLRGSNVSVDTVGLGGSTSMTVQGAVQAHYLTGAIGLRSDWFLAASARGQTAVEQGVVMHEIGHVLGLGHVDDPTQIMYARGRVGPPVYGAGDLAGLALLGSGHCEG